MRRPPAICSRGHGERGRRPEERTGYSPASRSRAERAGRCHPRAGKSAISMYSPAGRIVSQLERPVLPAFGVDVREERQIPADDEEVQLTFVDVDETRAMRLPVSGSRMRVSSRRRRRRREAASGHIELVFADARRRNRHERHRTDGARAAARRPNVGMHRAPERVGEVACLERPRRRRRDGSTKIAVDIGTPERPGRNPGNDRLQVDCRKGYVIEVAIGPSA